MAAGGFVNRDRPKPSDLPLDTDYAQFQARLDGAGQKVYIVNDSPVQQEVQAMPIYEYECKKCGKHFEIFQKMADEPLKECKFCKGRLQKLISQCSFQLKGTGWYVTDYKKPVDSAGKSGASGNEVKKPEKAETTAEATSAPTTSSEKKTETTATAT
jgi:putative FmdB family regulatory protein